MRGIRDIRAIRDIRSHFAGGGGSATDADADAYWYGGIAITYVPELKEISKTDFDTLKAFI